MGWHIRDTRKAFAGRAICGAHLNLDPYFNDVDHWFHDTRNVHPIDVCPVCKTVVRVSVFSGSRSERVAGRETVTHGENTYWIHADGTLRREPPEVVAPLSLDLAPASRAR